MSEQKQVEPWMRGTHAELDPLRRGVVHALEQAREDVERWCGGLEGEQLFAQPVGLPSVAFQMRHIARSLDRLLSYAEDRMLDPRQLAALETEHDGGSAQEVWQEFRGGIADALGRVRAFSPESFGEARGIGRKRLPTTLGGLLVHCAEHTQRHTGQTITTVKVLLSESRAAV